jgi:hypothetical protein
MRRYLAHIAIGLLLVAILVQYLENNSLGEEVVAEKQKVKEKQLAIDLLQHDKDLLQANNLKLTDSIGLINAELKKVKANIITIQKNRDEKLILVDHIPVGQLQGYFTKRYDRRKVK